MTKPMRPVTRAHDDEYSAAIANRNSRHDILDAFNGQRAADGLAPGDPDVTLQNANPGAGSAPGATNQTNPADGDQRGIPEGFS